MQQEIKRKDSQENDDIDLIALLRNILAKKILIASLTGFVTILTILYALNLPPSYQASSSFTPPSKSSVASINQLKLITETKQSIFSLFLSQLSSQDLQREDFNGGDFLSLFNPDNNPINDDVNIFISNITKSLTIIPPKETPLLIQPYVVTMNGGNAEAISQYLNAIVKLANSKVIVEIMTYKNLKISHRLDEILIEQGLLLENAKQKRLNQINRILEKDAQEIREINYRIEALKISTKQNRLNQIASILEEDAQKIREINDQINREEYKAKEYRINKIENLKRSLQLAKSLGVEKNNFKNTESSIINSDFIIVGATSALPDWYLYGEKALSEQIELLENGNYINPFIPELITLKNQLNEVQNNNLLKTLRERQDDSSFIPELVPLKIEKIRLESGLVNLSNVNAMQLIRPSMTPINPIGQNKKRLVLLAFFGSLIMSILLALILNGLRSDEKTSV